MRILPVLSFLVVSSASIPLCAADLIAVSGESTTNPESLFVMDKTNGTATLLLTLGNGAGGEAIAFRPQDGFIYHASGLGGAGDRFWESIDLTIPAVASSTQMTGDPGNQNIAIVYNPITNRFLVTDNGAHFFDVTQAGVATQIGTIAGGRLKGLAFRGTTLYGIQNQGNQLHTIDPATGTILTSVTVTLNGGGIEGGNGLAIDPATGTMYAILKPAAIGSDRFLSTLDPTTGAATSIGNALAEQYAGIVFAPEPNAAWALFAGILLLGRLRRSVRPTGSTTTPT